MQADVLLNEPPPWVHVGGPVHSGRPPPCMPLCVLAYESSSVLFIVCVLWGRIGN